MSMTMTNLFIAQPQVAPALKIKIWANGLGFMID